MTKDRIREYTLKITNASATGIIVIMYDRGGHAGRTGRYSVVRWMLVAYGVMGALVFQAFLSLLS